MNEQTETHVTISEKKAYDFAKVSQWKGICFEIHNIVCIVRLFETKNPKALLYTVYLPSNY